MKTNILFVTLIFMLSACDSPRSQRALSSTSNNLLTNNASTVNLDNGSGSSGGTGSNNSSNTTTTTPVIPSDATQCKFAADGATGFESESSHLGAYTLCQSSSDKSTFYFQLKTSPTNSNGDVSICFIPTTSSGSSSIYVGNPMCGYFKDPKAVRKINFIKYAQYANAKINGVIFFKDLSWYYPVFNSYMMTLDAYKTCMNMLAYGNSSYCQAFKQVGQYIYRQY